LIFGISIQSPIFIPHRYLDVKYDGIVMSSSPHPRPVWIIALVCLPIFIGALDLTVVSAVLPHVIYDLEIPVQTGLDDAAWVVSGYLLAYSIAMTFMGRLSDLVGRRKTYLLALVIFALGSYLVAVSDGWPSHLSLRMAILITGNRFDPSQIALWTLIGGRMIQAFGGGAMVPVGMALVGDLYPPEKRAQPLGMIAAVDTAGWVVGHLYGGILTRFMDWRLIFWLNLPFCLLAFILITLALRSFSGPHAVSLTKGRMDWLGALLITFCLTALNIGLNSNTQTISTFQEQQSSMKTESLPYILAALLFFGLFLWRQRRAAFPLISLSLFRRPNFFPACLANSLMGISLFIAIANVPLFINTLVAETLEQGAWDSGWVLSALTVPMALASIPGGWLTMRAGYRFPALGGMLMAIGGFLLMHGWQMETPYMVMLPHLVLAGIGFGLVMAPIAAAAINAAPSTEHGTASGLVIIFRLVGMTIGVSGIASYGVQRANQISQILMGSITDLAEVVRIGMQVAEQVIGETFWIAAAFAALSLIPILFLKTTPKERKIL
jgi:MFS family permease